MNMTLSALHSPLLQRLVFINFPQRDSSDLAKKIFSDTFDANVFETLILKNNNAETSYGF
jgi:hypothetical protein